MNRLLKKITLISATMLALMLLVMPLAAQAAVGDASTSSDDPMRLASAKHMTLRASPIGVGNAGGPLEIQIRLNYRDNGSFAGLALPMFSIEPVFDEALFDVLEFDLSAYTQSLGGLIVKTKENGNWEDDYFSFKFRVKQNALNGTYEMKYKVQFIEHYMDWEKSEPVTAEFTVLFRVENGATPKPEATPDPGPATANPSKAMLLIESIAYSPATIVAGDEFDLTLRFRNTTKYAISDVRAALSDETQTLLPANGSNTIYIASVGAGETQEAVVRIKTTPNAGIQPPVLSIAYSFVQKRVAYESKDDVTIPVAQLPNLQLDAPNYPTEVYEGDSLGITMNLFNKGKSTIYNVLVTLQAEGLRAEESYFAGNMEPGTTKTYDVSVSIEPGVSGPVSGKLLVTYEDNYGGETQREVPIEINIVAMDMGVVGDFDGGFKEGIIEIASEGPEAPAGLPVWVWFAGGGALLAIAAVVAILLVRRGRRKKDEETLDEME
ncbi:MAG: hypothetical protein LBD02_11025 [Christensenellaceae bacterium]|jgi:hypothetical protein|nr:hypothetical protein [Christensenellaceae bacterium]